MCEIDLISCRCSCFLLLAPCDDWRPSLINIICDLFFQAKDADAQPCPNFLHKKQ